MVWVWQLGNRLGAAYSYVFSFVCVESSPRCYYAELSLSSVDHKSEGGERVSIQSGVVCKLSTCHAVTTHAAIGFSESDGYRLFWVVLIWH